MSTSPDPAASTFAAGQNPPDDDAASAFLRRILADHAAGNLRGLDNYLASFPGLLDEIPRLLRLTATDRPEAPSSMSSADPRPGGRIAHYALDRELGRGGQGTVFLAHDTRLRRHVALKVLSDRGFRNPEARERFQREAAITSRLAHPGICTVYEAGEVGGIPYIAMEYLEGSSLTESLAAGPTPSAEGPSSFHVLDASTSEEPRGGSAGAPLGGTDAESPPDAPTIRRVVSLVAKVAHALHSAHEVGVIHRDVKPSNIRVRQDGTPVVLDFGMARDDDSNLPTLTRTDELFGTPPYMSPEQILRVRLDRRTDIWSLGVTLYECAVGRRPFSALTVEKLRVEISTAEPADPRRANPAIGRDLAAVIRTALEKSPDRRYATARGFAEDLERVLRGEPVLARPAGPARRLARWVLTHRAASLSVAAVVGSLLIGLVVSLEFAGRARDQARLATQRANDNVKLVEEWEALADVARLEALEREADQMLWPPTEDRIPAFTAWLERARAFVSRSDENAAILRKLRESALPESASGDSRDPESASRHEQRLLSITTEIEGNAAEADRLAKALAIDEQRLATFGSREEDERSIELRARLTGRCETARMALRALGDRTAALLAEKRRLEASATVRTEWTFADPRLQIRHDQLQRVVEGTEALRAPSPLMAPTIGSVERRREFAASVRRRTIDDAREAWEECMERLAADARFAPLGMVPQVGLLPLGPDPESGLEEFADLFTGVPPERDGGAKFVPTLHTGLVYVLLPGGPDLVGAQSRFPDQPVYDGASVDSEGPPESVSVQPFLLSKYEMTQGQWLRLTGTNPSQYGPLTPGATLYGHIIDERHPVEQVSLVECRDVLGRIGATLPTEVQWELAARAGTRDPWWTGPEPDRLAEAENLADAGARENGGPPGWIYEGWRDGFTVHAPVGSFRPNPFGLHDMLGNVQEWCRDPWDFYAKSRPRPTDGLRGPPGQQGTLGIVCRGGAFASSAAAARVSARLRNVPEVRSYLLGVRPVRPIHAASR